MHWPGLIGIRCQEGILQQVGDGESVCRCRRCRADGLLRPAVLQPLFRQGRKGGLRFTVQHLLVEEGRLVRLLESMQLDVTQKQRHYSPPAQDEALVLLV